MTDPFEARVGSTFADGKWTLERLIGVGGMAAVYAARHRLGHTSAIKILHPSVARSEDIRKRFEREAFAMGRLEHPGAVKVHDIDTATDGSPYIVMELLEGESLKELVVRRNGLPPDELVPIMAQALEVIAAAHDEGIVHRDLKPDNLFVTTEGAVKVLDFGIARMREGAAPMTQVGTRLGTLPYMPPEQVLGKEVDHRADIFAVGAVMFRILTKRRLHAAKTESEMIVKMSTLPAPAIQSVVATVPAAVAAVVDRALAFDKDQRYPDARSMLADLQAIAAGKMPAAAAGVASVTGAATPFVAAPMSAPTRGGDLAPASMPTRAGVSPVSAPTRAGAPLTDEPPTRMGAAAAAPAMGPSSPPSRSGADHAPGSSATMVSSGSPPVSDATMISGRPTGPTGTVVPGELAAPQVHVATAEAASLPSSALAGEPKRDDQKKVLIPIALAAGVLLIGGLAFALAGSGETSDQDGTSQTKRSDDDDGTRRRGGSDDGKDGYSALIDDAGDGADEPPPPSIEDLIDPPDGEDRPPAPVDTAKNTGEDHEKAEEERKKAEEERKKAEEEDKRLDEKGKGKAKGKKKKKKGKGKKDDDD